MDERLLIQLRDCFTGGYTLPQFCIDNGIRRPLFVAEGKFWQFMWEIYVQFRYDKRMTAQFSFLDVAPSEIDFSIHFVLNSLQVTHISQIPLNYFDAVICLTTKKIFKSGRVFYLDALTEYFIRKTYAEIPLLNFLQRYPQIKLFTTLLPINLDRYQGGTEFAKSFTHYITYYPKVFQENINADIVTPLDRFGYTHQEVLEMCSLHTKTTTNLDGTTILMDNAHPLIKIHNGKRTTAYQPETYQNKIYFVGICYYVGAFAPFDKTIESYLQKMLNEHGLPYRVENEGQYYGNRLQDMLYNLNKLTPAPGDIIFIWFPGNLTTNNLLTIDLRSAFDPPHDYKEFFIDQDHLNELGYKVLAESFFKVLTTNNFFRDKEFNYPLPPPLRTATASRRNTNGEARRLSKMQSWRLTSRPFAKRKFQSAQSS